MKDAYYFSHDSNARNDIKMIEFRSIYGYEGYGIFWAIIEFLREQNDWRISADKTRILSIGIGVEHDKLKPILDDCINIGLLTQKSGYIYSESLKRRMEYFEERREIARNNGKKGGRPKTKKKPMGYDLLNQNESKIKPVKESKEKESKGKSSKGEEIEQYKSHHEQMSIIARQYGKAHGLSDSEIDVYINKRGADLWEKPHGNFKQPITQKNIIFDMNNYKQRGWLKVDKTETENTYDPGALN